MAVNELHSLQETAMINRSFNKNFELQHRQAPAIVDNDAGIVCGARATGCYQCTSARPVTGRADVAVKFDYCRCRWAC